MRLYIIFILFGLTHYTSAQTKLVIGVSDIVFYEPNSNEPELDSIVRIDYKGKFAPCDQYQVYFDKNMENLAYQSFSKEDSCINIDYWRNGTPKKINKFKKNSEGLPVWVWSEKYCKSGQLIFAGEINNPERVHRIIYYCNGKKRIEFDQLGWGADGKMTTWHENGQIASVEYYDKNVEVGEWKFYDEDGNLIRTEKYENGELIETINN